VCLSRSELLDEAHLLRNARAPERVNFKMEGPAVAPTTPRWAGFWDVLADLAVSVVVPDRARTASLLQQPFVAWCVLLARGNGMRVVRR
jgi:hypothetical protein